MRHGVTEGYVPYPEPGGLLEWGKPYEGDSFHWRTSSESPDEWPVVAMGANGDWSEYAMSAVDLPPSAGEISSFLACLRISHAMSPKW